jgi:hypothetical protein
LEAVAILAYVIQITRLQKYFVVVCYGVRFSVRAQERYSLVQKTFSNMQHANISSVPAGTSFSSKF